MSAPSGLRLGLMGILCNLAHNMCSINIHWSTSKRTDRFALSFVPLQPKDVLLAALVNSSLLHSPKVCCISLSALQAFACPVS